jgi:hypothetical protein
MCNDQHGDHCQKSEPRGIDKLWQPRWLVDTERDCVTPYKQSDRYVALSYVWGKECGFEGQLRLTLDNLGELQEDGALRKESFAKDVPVTIKNTMGLVNLLGLRYLWVDRLCIVQDDPANKTAQINSMGYIYGGAYLTIVATAGYDANHGLKGILGVSAAKTKSDFYMGKSQSDDEDVLYEYLRPRRRPFVAQSIFNGMRQRANAKDVPDGRSRQRHHHLVAQSTWNRRG